MLIQAQNDTPIPMQELPSKSDKRDKPIAPLIQPNSKLELNAKMKNWKNKLEGNKHISTELSSISDVVKEYVNAINGCRFSKNGDKILDPKLLEEVIVTA